MNALLETSLPDQPLLELKRRVDPAEFARRLRARGDVFYWEPDRFWVVTGHALALRALRDGALSADRSAYFGQRLSSCPFARVAGFLGVVKRMMVTSDPPEHTARRRAAAAGVSDEVLERFRPAVERVVDGLVAGVAGRSSWEFVSTLALPLPNTVLADLFAVPEERRADFYRWSNAMTQLFGGGAEDVLGDADRANAGALALRAYFLELVAERRRHPQDDFLSRLAAEQAAAGLGDEELVSQAAMMLVAGTVTTTDQLANDLNVLLSEPGLWERLAARPDLTEAAVEEATRLDPAVNFVFRAAKADLELGGARVRPGELVFVSAHAANRDPRVFADSDAFRLDRARNPHLSYGAGIHYCLGAQLGRIQLRAVIRRLSAQFPHLRLAREAAPARKQQSLGFSGFESLPLEVA